MSETSSEPSVSQRLVDDVRGDVLQAGDEGYDEALTVWNTKIDEAPAAIRDRGRVHQQSDRRG